MSPENARAVRRARLARLLKEEPGLTRKELAQRLGLKKDTLRRDLAAIAHDAPAQEAPARQSAAQNAPALPAPQLSRGEAHGAHEARTEDRSAVQTPAHQARAEGEPAAQEAPRMALPRRRPAEELVIDLSRSPGLRRDLAVLEATGLSPEALVAKAVAILRFGHEQAVRAGRLRPGAPFVALDVTVGPPPTGLRRPAPARGA